MTRLFGPSQSKMTNGKIIVAQPLGERFRYYERSLRISKKKQNGSLQMSALKSRVHQCNTGWTQETHKWFLPKCPQNL